MPRVRDLLYRFRPAGAPGAAGPVGVPADRGPESAAELEPVFAQLVATQQECAQIRAEARREAQDIRQRGQRQAQDVAAAAIRQAEQERAGAAARLTQDGHSRAQVERQAAEEAVARLQRRAADAVPAYVDTVVGRVASLIGAPTDVPASPVEAR